MGTGDRKLESEVNLTNFLNFCSIVHFRVPKCKTFLVKMSFIFKRIKNRFQINGLALSLALKQRLGTTLKLPIDLSQSLTSM